MTTTLARVGDRAPGTRFPRRQGVGDSGTHPCPAVGDTFFGDVTEEDVRVRTVTQSSVEGDRTPDEAGFAVAGQLAEPESQTGIIRAQRLVFVGGAELLSTGPAHRQAAALIALELLDLTHEWHHDAERDRELLVILASGDVAHDTGVPDADGIRVPQDVQNRRVVVLHQRHFGDDFDPHVEQRLPSTLTYAGTASVAALLITSAALDSRWPDLVRALLGLAVLMACYFGLALIFAGDLGAGDVKLSGLLGLVLGWQSWSAVVTGTFFGWLAAALAWVVLRALGRREQHATLPLGPFLLTGAFAAIIFGTPA